MTCDERGGFRSCGRGAGGAGNVQSVQVALANHDM